MKFVRRVIFFFPTNNLTDQKCVSAKSTSMNFSHFLLSMSSKATSESSCYLRACYLFCLAVQWHPVSLGFVQWIWLEWQVVRFTAKWGRASRHVISFIKGICAIRYQRYRVTSQPSGAWHCGSPWPSAPTAFPLQKEPIYSIYTHTHTHTRAI